ncbi:catechol 2,3-dioxygenase-like lactoylglutathione lyase family enzyme [Streptosporangium album]|uniref:Catechol 2,3-dioxygenase-like lactoylglutathione lyase family enzyme n=1 Tax=Streptosporangium album TaxID=47479 RepID=A0A7W7S3G8_9ACTN|nr:VOC family protein [Streptosporangium album]MBB4943145.1 catechol 2,3-dioxygenase-like lactoylglutathione lyase family enzyme [Streptosporangium album]
MPAQLNHTIMHSSDRFASARFLTDLLGAPEPKAYGPFAAVPLANGVTVDYADSIVTPDRIVMQHLAFLVSEDEFDEIHARITERGLPYWGDPAHREPQQINHRHNGRGVYVDDPDGHAIEFLTHPYVTDH